MPRKKLGAEFSRVFREDGAWYAIRRTGIWIVRRGLQWIGLELHDPVYRRQIYLSRKLAASLGSTIAYGPFRGLRFGTRTWWAGAERSAMLLGIYEQELLNAIVEASSGRTVFVDIGAADGYYGIGVLKAGLFDKSHCFEASSKGRTIITSNALLNGVEARLVVHGPAQRGFHTEIPPDDLQRAVLLLDIEGGEFDILDAETFHALRKCIIFVELHDRLFVDAPAKRAQLLADASKTHEWREITTTSRDLSVFPELDDLGDTDRWLLCSERRAWRMTWLRFDPALAE